MYKLYNMKILILIILIIIFLFCVIKNKKENLNNKKKLICFSLWGNKGIEKSKGKYNAFYDDDDIWFPNKLEVQIKKRIVYIYKYTFNLL